MKPLSSLLPILTTGLCTGAAVCLVFLAVPAASGSPSASTYESPTNNPVREWIDRKVEWYDAHPDLKTTRGSGWKPLNRIRWFHESRMPGDRIPPAGARIPAWKRRQELEQRGAALRGGGPWFSLGPTNRAGRVLCMAFDPKTAATIYVGAAGGGLWKTTDSGDSWRPLTDDLPTPAIGGVAVDPADSAVVVIATGEATMNVDRINGVGIWRSTNAGETWKPTSLTYEIAAGHGFHFLEANPLNGTMLAGATDGLWRSEDGGETWVEVMAGGEWYDADWKPGDENVVYAARGGTFDATSGLQISTDDGLTWAMAGAGQPVGEKIGKTKIAVTAADPERVYAIIVDLLSSELLGVYRSTDGGEVWRLQFQASDPQDNIPSSQGYYNLSLAVSPVDAERLWAGGVWLYESTDGGLDWTILDYENGDTVHADHHVARIEPGTDSTLWVGTDGGFWRSEDNGATWVDRNEGLVTYQFYDICNAPSDPTVVFGGTQDNGTDKWVGTTDWLHALPGGGSAGDGMVCNVGNGDSAAVYVEKEHGNHFRSTNGGEAFFPFNNGLTGVGRWVAPVAINPQNEEVLFSETSDGVFQATWSEIFGTLRWDRVADHNARWIDVSEADTALVWTVDATGAPWISEDAGDTWTEVSEYGFDAPIASKVLAHPTDRLTAFVTFSAYDEPGARVARTTDLGVTWEDVTGDLPLHPVNAIAVDEAVPEFWYIGTDVGVWVSPDDGQTWIPFEDDLPNAVVHDLEIHRGARKLRAGTHGRGMWEADLIPEGTPVSELAVAPRDILLDPPFPNPAQGDVRLRFAARGASLLTLGIYDVAGRRVAWLGEFPGDGTIRTHTWYTDDVPAGTYFAVATHGDQRIARKVIVTR